MKSLGKLLGVGLVLLATGCSSISVRDHYDREADWASLKTFDWMVQSKDDIVGEQAPIARTREFHEGFKDIVRSQLRAKGLTQEARDPDFLIAYYIGVLGKLDAPDKSYTDDRYDRDRLRWGSPGRDLEVPDYREGTLILNFIDAETKDVIWQGIGEVAVSESKNMTPEKVMAGVKKTIQKMLEKFPPVPPASL